MYTPYLLVLTSQERLARVPLEVAAGQTTTDSAENKFI